MAYGGRSQTPTKVYISCVSVTPSFCSLCESMKDVIIIIISFLLVWRLRATGKITAMLVLWQMTKEYSTFKERSPCVKNALKCHRRHPRFVKEDSATATSSPKEKTKHYSVTTWQFITDKVTTHHFLRITYLKLSNPAEIELYCKLNIMICLHYDNFTFGQNFAFLFVLFVFKDELTYLIHGILIYVCRTKKKA